MNAEELKACPFCGCSTPYKGRGGLKSQYNINPVEVFYIFCCCGARSGAFATMREAIEAWNRRSGFV